MLTVPKQQSIIISISTLLAVFSTASILAFTDPNHTSLVSFVFLYASVFLVFLGSCTLIGLSIRQWLNPGHYVVNLKNSFRQALFLSVLLTVSLWLMSAKLMFWWVEASLILFFVFLEAFLNLKI